MKATTDHSHCLRLFLLVLVLLGVSLPSLRATMCYVVNSGNNSADNSEDSSWATIAKVNAWVCNLGDNALSRRGDAWFGERGAIKTSSNFAAPIIYGAYGMGDKPVLDGSHGMDACIIGNNPSNAIIGDIAVQNYTSAGAAITNFNNVLRQRLTSGMLATMGSKRPPTRPIARPRSHIPHTIL